MTPRLAVVVPCYNEEEMLPLSMPVFLDMLDTLRKSGEVKSDSFLLFVDDGSTDSTWRYIADMHFMRNDVRGIRLSRNFGQQNALYAGIMKAGESCDIVVTMDADLQDDVQVLPEMLEKYKKGSEIVYGMRFCRNMDTGLKKYSAALFYRLLKFIDPRTVRGHADFRLMSSRVVELLKEHREQNLYLRGIVSDMGFESSEVMYERRGRDAGCTGYSAGKMVELALNGLMRSERLQNLFYKAPVYAFAAIVCELIISCGKGSGKGAVISGRSMAALILVSQAMLLSMESAVLKEARQLPRYIVCDTAD